MKLDQFKDVNLVIDKANDVFIPRQFVSQGDYKGRTLTVQITHNGSIGEVPGLTLNLNWHNEASGMTDLTAFTILNKENNIFRIEYPEHMMTPGKVYASIQVIQDGKVTNLKQFELIVQKLAGQPVGIVEKAEFSALVAVLADSNKFRTDIDSLSSSKADKNYINDYLSKVTVVPETFANLAAIQAKYPNGANGIMVAADNGHKYIWANGSWIDAGTYQGIAITDDQLSKIQQSIFNQGNLIGNGYFSTKDGAFGSGHSTITLTDMIGQKWVAVYSNNVEAFNGIGFNFSPSAKASWTDKSSSIFFAEFDIVSGYDCNLCVDIGYTEGSTTVTDTLTTLFLSSNSATHQKFMFVKDPYKNGNDINLLIRNPNAEPINFSVANLKITRSSYLL